MMRAVGKNGVGNLEFNRYSPSSYTAYEMWSRLAPEGTYRNVPLSAMAGLLPQNLLAKANSILLQASASGIRSYFVANINRVDTPTSAVDQQPYIVEFDHDALSTYGGFLDHPDWLGRTSKQSQDFFNHIAASGTGACYPLSEMPTSDSGSLDDLRVSSQCAAFRNAFSALQVSKK